MPAKSITCSLLIIASFVCVGCQRNEIAKPLNSDPAQPSQGDENAIADTTTNSVLPSETTTASPAAESQKRHDETPELLCQKFMELLQSGDRGGAENLLTRASMVNIVKAGLKLEPMGGPNARFEIKEAQYATGKRRLAQVECVISEPVDGDSQSMTIAWQCRRRGDEWRISGVILDLEEGSTPDLLSFENVVDVAQLQSVASGDVIEESEPTSRQADASKSSLK